MQLVELLKDRNNWVDWKFLTKKDNLVSVASEFPNNKTNLQYMNGHTPLDWIRMGNLDEVIARVLKVFFTSDQHLPVIN